MQVIFMLRSAPKQVISTLELVKTLTKHTLEHAWEEFLLGLFNYILMFYINTMYTLLQMRNSFNTYHIYNS